jgi:hypothetical protein
MRNESDKIVGKIKTQIVCSVTFPENCAVYEISVEKYDTARQATYMV